MALDLDLTNPAEGRLSKLVQRIMATGGRMAPLGAATVAAAPIAIPAAVAAYMGPPRPEFSDDGDAAFARLAASTGGTGLLNTPEEVGQLASDYFGRRGPQWGTAPKVEASPAPAPDPASEAATQADALKWLLAQEGSNRGAGRVSVGENKSLADLLEKIRSVKTGLGAYDASQKPTTKILDKIQEEAALRSANPLNLPNNDAYWMWQNAPKWVGGDKGFETRGDPNGAARVMLDIDKKVTGQNDALIARLLGHRVDAVAGENLLANEDFLKRRAPLAAQMPDKLEADIVGDMVKDSTDRARINAAAGEAEARRSAADPVRKLAGAYQMLAEGEKKKDPQMVRMANAIIKMLNPKDKPEKWDEKLHDKGMASFDSKFGEKLNNPKIKQLREIYERGLYKGQNPAEAMMEIEEALKKGL